MKNNTTYISTDGNKINFLDQINKSLKQKQHHKEDPECLITHVFIRKKFY